MKRLFNILGCIAASHWYWLGVIALVLAMEAVALVYQYAWDFGPCVHCIHVRIWLLGMLLVGLLALWLRRWPYANAAMHLLNAGLMYGLLNTSLQLLWTEQGKIIGSCSFDLGLPSWFALDRWFPTIFEVQEACGDTPELLFGITMAEALVLFAGGMIAVSLVLMVAGIVRARR